MKHKIKWMTGLTFSEDEKKEIEKITAWAKDKFKSMRLTTGNLQEVELQAKLLFQESDAISVMNREHHDVSVMYSPTEGILVSVEEV